MVVHDEAPWALGGWWALAYAGRWGIARNRSFKRSDSTGPDLEYQSIVRFFDYFMMASDHAQFVPSTAVDSTFSPIASRKRFLEERVKSRSSLQDA